MDLLADLILCAGFFAACIGIYKLGNKYIKSKNPYIDLD